MYIGPSLIVAVSDPDAVIFRLVPYVTLAETCVGSGVPPISLRGMKGGMVSLCTAGSILLREVCKSAGGDSWGGKADARSSMVLWMICQFSTALRSVSGVLSATLFLRFHVGATCHPSSYRYLGEL